MLVIRVTPASEVRMLRTVITVASKFLGLGHNIDFYYPESGMFFTASMLNVKNVHYCEIQCTVLGSRPNSLSTFHSCFKE